MTEDNKTTVTVGGWFLPALALIFAAAKVFGYISWSWWWVFAPIWIPFAIVLAIIVVMLLVMGVAYATNEARLTKARKRHSRLLDSHRRSY